MNNWTDKQKSLVIASVMGDGWIAKPSTYSCWMGIQHCEKQLEYLLWKKSRFEAEGFSTSRVYDVSRKFSAYQFRVWLHRNGIALRHELYPNGDKVITRHYLNWMDEEGLAIWFMDDGTRRLQRKNGIIQSRQLYFCTHSFTENENEIISKYLDTVWDIRTKVAVDRNRYYLKMGAIEAKKLIAIIEPYIHPSMLYKINLEYKR